MGEETHNAPMTQPTQHLSLIIPRDIENNNDINEFDNI